MPPGGGGGWGRFSTGSAVLRWFRYIIVSIWVVDLYLYNRSISRRSVLATRHVHRSLTRANKTRYLSIKLKKQTQYFCAYHYHNDCNRSLSKKLRFLSKDI